MQTVESKMLISEMLAGSFEAKKNVRLWQNLGGKKRQEFEAKCYRLNESKDELWFSFNQNIANIDFSFPIYGYIEERKVVFKSKLLFCGAFKIVIRFPQKIKLKSIRVEDRMADFKASEIIQYKLGRLDEQMSFTHSYSARVLNKSVSGLGLIVKGSEANKFYSGDYITIKDISGTLRNAQIRHKTLLTKTQLPGQFQIGLCYMNDGV